MDESMRWAISMWCSVSRSRYFRIWSFSVVRYNTSQFTTFLDCCIPRAWLGALTSSFMFQGILLPNLWSIFRKLLLLARAAIRRIEFFVSEEPPQLTPTTRRERARQSVTLLIQTSLPFPCLHEFSDPFKTRWRPQSSKGRLPFWVQEVSVRETWGKPKKGRQGWHDVGKSSLCTRYVEGHFVESYYPTVEGSFSQEIQHKGQTFLTEIIDTQGQVSVSARLQGS